MTVCVFPYRLHLLDDFVLYFQVFKDGLNHHVCVLKTLQCVQGLDHEGYICVCVCVCVCGCGGGCVCGGVCVGVGGCVEVYLIVQLRAHVRHGFVTFK